jgi:hypothetical protein
MSSSARRFRRPPNPVTQAAFRRQVRLEVYLPLVLVGVVLAVLVAVVIGLAYGTTSSWADVALVMLALPLALLMILVTAALAGGIYLMFVLIREIPPVTSGLHQGADQVAEATRRGSDVVIRPIVVPSGIVAALAEVGRSVRAIFRPK